MNVLMLTPDYPPNIYCGIGSHVFQLVNGLAKKCESITILVIRTHIYISNQYIEESHGNIRIIQYNAMQLESQNSTKLGRLLKNNLNVLDSIDEVISNKNFDIIHVHEVYPSIVYNHLLNKYDLPSVATIHAMTSDSTTLIDAFRRYLRIKPEVVITVSNALKKACISRYGNEDYYPEIKVIPNGVTIGDQKVKIEKEEMILFCGRLIEIKGCDILIKAFGEMVKKKQFVNYTLHIIGDGPEKQNLLKLTDNLSLSKYIVFHGYLENEEVRHFMRRAKCLVMPSKYEGFPVTALEAMAENCCVICSDVGGLPELVQHGYNGVVVSSNTELEFAEKMESLLESRELCAELCDNAYKTAVNYEWENIAKQMFDTYKIAMELYLRKQ